jgi:hydroxymethylglutaryl-CoA synthase
MSSTVFYKSRFFKPPSKPKLLRQKTYALSSCVCFLSFGAAVKCGYVMVGIISYGYYVPHLRVKVTDIAPVWGADPSAGKALGVEEKAVGAWDEDSCTFAVDAARMAIKCSGINPQELGAVFVGSESKPYAVKPSATIVAEAIEATPVLTAGDFEFACKAGTVAMQTCMAMVTSGMVKYGLAIGSDTAQAQPGDPLEYTAGGGAAAFLIGKEKVIATINDTFSPCFRRS